MSSNDSTATSSIVKLGEVECLDVARPQLRLVRSEEFAPEPVSSTAMTLATVKALDVVMPETPEDPGPQVRIDVTPTTATWEHALSRRAGHVQPTLGNAVAILTYSPDWQGALHFDELRDQVALNKRIPGCEQKSKAGMYWSDDLSNRTSVWIEKQHRVAVPRNTISDAARLVAQKDTRHPIQGYLDTLRWDGKKRLDKWLVRYLRCEDTPYVRAVGAKWMISAVARAFAPGCKVDHVLVIQGQQRGGKSTALSALCTDENWFLDTGVPLGCKDAYQIIQSKWIVELGEMRSLRGAAIEQQKQFITSRTDTYRPSHGREVVNRPRTCVFAGTSNSDAPLTDPTGNGRYWLVRSATSQTNLANIRGLRKERDQLWAEAVHRYKAGEAWHLTDPDVIAAAQAAQDAGRQAHPWETNVAEILGASRYHTDGISVRTILGKLGIDNSDERKVRAATMTIGSILGTLKWIKGARVHTDTGREYLYRPGPNAAPPRAKRKATPVTPGDE